MYNIPILFIIFRRKDIALQSFERIKQVKPSKLYIACDGARENVKGEAELVKATQESILQQIDWECNVRTLFQKENLGCGKGVYTAINWFFENEEEGIIIEDDCVLQSSFFPFAEELLNKYGYNGKDKNYWRYRIKAIENNYVSAWDWQWFFTLSAYNQLSIYPRIGLISNIGFGKDATHTTAGAKQLQSKAEGQLVFPLRHPKYVVPYEDFEQGFYKSNNTFRNTILQLIPFSLKTILKKWIRG